MPSRNLPKEILLKSLDILTKRQTNILSAAFVIMGTVVLSLLLGLVKKRLLIALFGASSVSGIYDIAYKLPDLVFQLVFASAISTAFIPVFSDYLTKNREKEAHEVASTLLTWGMLIFAGFSLILVIFAPFFLTIFNVGMGFSPHEMQLMSNLVRIVVFAEFLFIIGIFFTALLQSYNHFFIPGFALALYNLGIIIGLLTLSPFIGIYSGAVGSIIGALFFIGLQLPLIKRVGFHYKPALTLKNAGVQRITQLMWPRTISNAVIQFGTVLTISLISFRPDPGRDYIILDLAQTLAFAPVSLVGQAIAQAAFPVLSRERERLDNFKETFLMSFNQMLYLVLPISVLLLVLRIPVVRLVFGAKKLDWDATVLAGRTLAFFSISIFAQALLTLVYRAFYALHDTKTPLIASSVTTVLMLIMAYVMIVPMKMGVESIAIAYTVSSVLQLIVLLILLERKTGKFQKVQLLLSWLKIFAATFFTAFALYIPLKLLDQLVIDTTHTVGLLILTGISSLAGLFLYLFLTWFFDVKEAKTYLLALQKIGNWKEVTTKVQEIFEGKIDP